MPLAYEPATLFPELELTLELPFAAASEADRARLLAELETSIRKSGQVARSSGEVGASSIALRVRYQPGVDIDRKATVLDSLLGDLRRGLPAGAYLQVRPQGGRSGAAAFVAEVAAADPAMLEAVRRLPGVAAAHYSGALSPELRLELPSESPVTAREVAAALHPRRLGRWPGENGAVDVATAATPLEEIRFGRASLEQLGTFSSAPGDPAQAARVRGHPAQLLVVDRAAGASPLRLERDLERAIAAAGQPASRFLREESRPLRRLLLRFFGALAAGSLLLGLFHLLLFSGRAAAWQLLALPLGLAGALPPLFLAGAALDVLTLPALLLAILLAPLPAALGRRGGAAWGRLAFAAAAAAALPVALALLGRLGIFLGAPAKSFLIALVAAAAVQLLLPAAGPPRAAVAAAARRLQGLARRRSGALLLATVVCLYLSWIFCASALWPRTGSLGQDIGDLALSVQLPRESSFAATEAAVERVERQLAARPGVRDFFALYRRGQANFYLELAPDQKSRARIEITGRQLEQRLRALGIVARAQPLGGAQGGPALSFDDADEFQPRTDQATRSYRVLLRGADFDIVAATAAWLRQRMRRSYGGSEGIDLAPEWRPPEPALELAARSGADRRQIGATGTALTAFFARDAPARLPSLPGQTAPLLLRRVRPGDPGGPPREPLLEEALAVLRGKDADLARHFALRETATPPELHWQSGLYVLPLDFEIRTPADTWTLARAGVHETLERLPLPPGTDLVLPELDGEPFVKRLRLLAAVALLPLLLLALLAMRLDSLALAVAALLPGLGALAAAAPLLMLHAGGLDEATLLALAATVAGFLPLAATSAGACRAPRDPAPTSAGFSLSGLWATRGHRELSRILPRVAPFLGAAVLVLLFAGADLDAGRNPWVKGQRAAGIALLAGAALAFFVSPALQVGTEALLRSLRREERIRRRALSDPPAWRAPGDNVLEVRSLSKRYANGFRALRKVDLRLEPGIVGLLGPNGAGKTTLLRTLCGTLAPSRGQVHFRGQPVLPENLAAFRRRVGYLPQSFNAWDGLSAERFLDYWADLLHLPEGEQRRDEIAAALGSVGLEAKAKHAVRELSGGQRRRLGIARALLGQPPILIVDEPTTGLDVEARNQLRQSLVALAEDRIVIFSTHIASDIAAVTRRVLILDKGRLLFDGPPAELIAGAQGRVFERQLAEEELRPFSRRFHITTRIREPEGIRVRAVTHPGQEPEGELVLPNLEEAYLARLGSTAKKRDERSWASLLDLETWRSQ